MNTLIHNAIISPKYIQNVELFYNKALELLSAKYCSYSIERLLGRGKGGYSFLVTINNKHHVLKLIHYEKTGCYDFGDQNKTRLELGNYNLLRDLNIKLPEMIDYCETSNYILKKYIAGELASNLIAENKVDENIFKQLFTYSLEAKRVHVNLDYFPPNFVIQNNELYYIDYETSPYSEEWNLINWGLYYWCNNEGMANYLLKDDINEINIGPGKPYRDAHIEKQIKNLLDKIHIAT